MSSHYKYVVTTYSDEYLLLSVLVLVCVSWFAEVQVRVLDPQPETVTLLNHLNGILACVISMIHC